MTQSISQRKTKWENTSQFYAQMPAERVQETHQYLANIVKVFCPEGIACPRDGSTCDFAGSGVTASASHPDKGYWAARVETAAWRLHLVTTELDDTLQFGVRFQTVGTAFPAEVAGFVRRKLAELPDVSGGLEHARASLGKPLSLTRSHHVDFLEILLRDAERRMPILLVSETDPYRRIHETGHSKFLLDPDRLAVDLLDAMIVATIDYEVAYELSERFSRPWSCFLGAVRIYHRDIDFVGGDPWDHPLCMPQKVSEHFVADQAGRARALSAKWKDNDFFWPIDFLDSPQPQRRAPAAEVIADAPATSAEVGIPQSEIAADPQGLLLRVTRLEAELERLRAAMRRMSVALPSTAFVPIPASLNDLADWVEQYYGGELVLAGRARRGAKESRYKDAPLVYRCLQFLATTYRNARLPDMSNVGLSELDEELAKLGVTLERSTTPSRAGEQDKEYFITWPTPKDGQRFLEYHLRKGNSREQENCLRIYFFWDSQREQVVVGWLTSHLTLRIS